MPTNEEYLEKLYEVRNSGILTISIDGQTITYRNMAELERAIAVLEKPAKTGIQRVFYPKFARGDD